MPHLADTTRDRRGHRGAIAALTILLLGSLSACDDADGRLDAGDVVMDGAADTPFDLADDVVTDGDADSASDGREPDAQRTDTAADAPDADGLGTDVDAQPPSWLAALDPCPEMSLAELLDPVALAFPPRDSDAFVLPTTTTTDALHDGLISAAMSVAPTASAPWSLCRLEATANPVLVWRAEPASGRASVALRLDGAVPTRPLLVGAPHPVFEVNTLDEAVMIFERTNARALVVAGAHRCSSDAETTCDGRTGVCGAASAPYRISDPAHEPRTSFHAAHVALLVGWPELSVLSLHGMGGDGVSLSAGVAGEPVPADGLLGRVATELTTRLTGEAVTTCNPLPDTLGVPHDERLCGTTNVQGRLVNGAAPVCTTFATTPIGRFLHIEQSRAVRDRIDDVAAAIAAATEAP